MSKNRSNHKVQSVLETIIESIEQTVPETATIELTKEVETIEQTVIEPTKEETKLPNPNEMIKDLKTKSAVIRALSSTGMKVGAIHKLLKDAGWHSDRNPSEPIRYQHVRNVLTTKLVGKKEETKTA